MNDFTKKSISHIPADVIQSMVRETGVDPNDVDANNPVEALMKMRQKHLKKIPGVPGSEPTTNVPEPQQRFMAVGGFILPCDANTMLMYILATELSKNKKVAKLLEAFEFSMKDINGKVIYPNGRNTSKKRRSK